MKKSRRLSLLTRHILPSFFPLISPFLQSFIAVFSEHCNRQHTVSMSKSTGKLSHEVIFFVKILTDISCHFPFIRVFQLRGG